MCNTLEDRIISVLDNEIQQSNELLSILGDSEAVIDTENLSDDIMAIKREIKYKEGFKSMVMKLAIREEGVDNEKLLTVKEKAIFYNIVKVVMLFRKIISTIKKGLVYLKNIFTTAEKQ